MSMTRAKHSSQYPQVFFDIAEAISKDPTLKVEKIFESKEAAKAFRLDFYSFRGCVVREGGTDMFPELNAVVLLVDKETGRKMVIMHKDHTELALGMSEALARAKSMKLQ